MDVFPPRSYQRSPSTDLKTCTARQFTISVEIDWNAFENRRPDFKILNAGT